MRLFSPQARIRERLPLAREQGSARSCRWRSSFACDEQSCAAERSSNAMELVGTIQQEIGQLDEVGSSLSTVTFGRSLDVGGSGEGMGGAAARAFGLGAAHAAAACSTGGSWPIATTSSPAIISARRRPPKG